MAAGNPQNTSPPKDDGGASQSTQSKKKAAGKKGNSGSSKKMTAKEQSERFIQTARELELDESGENFDVLVDKILVSNRST